jgi:hypothetical protein
VRGCFYSGIPADTTEAVAERRGQEAARRYPLPKRTRQVLREEPVPGDAVPVPMYRFNGGLQRHYVHPSGRTEWNAVYEISANDYRLMAHALDLLANPYRTEEMEADESNPWGDDA